MPLTPLAPFVDYEPNPQGPGYLFHHNSGNKYISYGPAADQLRAQIDFAKKQQQAQQLALNGNGMNAADAQASFDAGAPNAGPAVPDVGPAPVMAPPQAPAAPEPQRTGVTVEPPSPATKAEPSNEPPGKVTPPDGNFNPWKGPAPTSGPAAAPQGQPLPISPLEYHAPVDPRRMAANAVAVPTGQSVVREGGIQDPERRQEFLDTAYAQIEAEKNLAKVQENAATTQLENERANLLEAQKRQQDAEEAIAAQQARQALLRKEFDNRMAIAQQDYDVSSKKEVDQYRLFKGSAGATTSGILATIGAAMGAAATAYRPGMQNYAMQILNQTINNDVEAQRDEIHRGVAKSTNDIRRISDQYNLDYDDAASVLKMNYLRRADAELAKKAALTGTQQAQLAYAQAQPVLQKNIADIQAQMEAKLNGQVKTVQESKMVQPSAGGFSPKPLKKQAEEAKALADISVAESTVAHGGQRPGAQGSDKPKDGYTQQTISSINAAQVGEHALRHAAEIGGMKVDEDGNVHIVDAGKFAAAQLPGSQYQKAMESAVPEVVRGQTGAAPTVEGQEHAREQFSVGGLGITDALLPPVGAARVAGRSFAVPNAIQENIKLLRSAQRIRIENKKYPVAAGGQSGSGDEGGAEQ